MNYPTSTGEKNFCNYKTPQTFPHNLPTSSYTLDIYTLQSTFSFLDMAFFHQFLVVPKTVIIILIFLLIKVQCSHLWTVTNIVALTKTQMAQIICRWYSYEARFTQVAQAQFVELVTQVECGIWWRQNRRCWSRVVRIGLGGWKGSPDGGKFRLLNELEKFNSNGALYKKRMTLTCTGQSLLWPTGM